MIGLTLGDYRIIAELGSGGMGTVYYGEHQVIGRRAAIKVLHPAVAARPDLVERFFTEARAVNSIRHPHIVDVTDCGQADGIWYLLMEFLEGETLGARLEVVRLLPEDLTRRILLQVASALAAVHERGIVHRDLKPENIFLTHYKDYPDYVKVLDFGVVKVGADIPRGAGGVTKTQPGTVIGTPAYMSPEQCVGDEHLDHRSDVYSLGIMAYEMLTGGLPFSGSISDVIRGHLSVEPMAPKALVPQVSQAMSDLVMRMMAKRREDRVGSMRELREYLRTLTAGEELELPALRSVEDPAPEDAPAPAPRGAPVEVADAPREDVPPSEGERAAAVERHQVELVTRRLARIIARRLKDNSLTLPAFPLVATKCLRMARDVQTTFTALAEQLARDPMVASRLLRVANSAAYAGSQRTTTLETAVSKLGLKPLAVLLQELAAEQVFTSRNPRIRNAFRTVWEHCLAVGHVTRRLATLVVRGPDPETAYLAGLFHDIGKPLVATVLLEAERGLLDEQVGKWMSEGVWTKVVESCHRDVGYSLAMKWGLPDAVARAIGQHDAYDPKAGAQSCTNLVRLANALCEREGMDLVRPDFEENLRAVVTGQRLLGLTDAQLEQAMKGTAELVQAVTEEAGLTTTRVRAS